MTDKKENAPERVDNEILQFSNIPDGEGFPDGEPDYDPTQIAQPPPQMFGKQPPAPDLPPEQVPPDHTPKPPEAPKE